MLHFYDESTDTVETQCLRLLPALEITQRGIPCLVWAEDALSFVYFVPTSLFALQLLVPDRYLEAAALAITSTLPYARLSQPCPTWLERRYMDPARPSSFPNSVYLHATVPSNDYDRPVKIYLHPASFFHFPDILDCTRTVTLSSTLPAPYARIRFPTRPAFLDALFDVMLDPPSGLRVHRLTSMLNIYVHYICLYTLRTQPSVLPNGNLEHEYAAVRDSLKEENRAVFEYRVRGHSLVGGWRGEMEERRRIMKTTIRFEQAQRPYPLDTLRLRSITQKDDLQKLGKAKK